MAGVINIERDKRKAVLEDKIDKDNYLNLRNDRTTLIALGIALGLDRPLEIKRKDALSKASTFEENYDIKAITTSACIYHLQEGQDLNEMIKEEVRYELASNCLNRGIDTIEYNIENISKENRIYKLLNDLDDLYLENVENK